MLPYNYKHFLQLMYACHDIRIKYLENILCCLHGVPRLLERNVCQELFFSPLLFLVDQRHLLCIYSPLPPLRGQPTVEYPPRWQPIRGLAVHCRLRRLPNSNSGLQVYSLVLLPMSLHCSQELLIIIWLNVC
jgi:hypothetical protein